MINTLSASIRPKVLVTEMLCFLLVCGVEMVWWFIVALFVAIVSWWWPHSQNLGYRHSMLKSGQKPVKGS